MISAQVMGQKKKISIQLNILVEAAFKSHLNTTRPSNVNSPWITPSISFCLVMLPLVKTFATKHQNLPQTSQIKQSRATSRWLQVQNWPWHFQWNDGRRRCNSLQSPGLRLWEKSKCSGQTTCHYSMPCYRSSVFDSKLSSKLSLAISWLSAALSRFCLWSLINRLTASWPLKCGSHSIISQFKVVSYYVHGQTEADTCITWPMTLEWCCVTCLTDPV